MPIRQAPALIDLGVDQARRGSKTKDNIMGLDITAYSKLKAVRPRPKYEDESGYAESLESLPPNHASQADRMEGMEPKTWYRVEGKTFGFRAGSYSGYNRWREWLAELAGHGSPQNVWNNPKPGPFVELINFSDCEGTIGPVVSAKLAKDFAEWDDRAKAADKADGYDYGKYREWRKAFEMAADGGAVTFH